MNLILNAIQTPDGTIMYSRTVHDYKTHKDANGKTYMVDGGLEYIRRSAHGDEIDLSLTDDEPHSVQRSVLTWGTYGINGDEPLHRVSIKDMTTGHILAVLDGHPPRAVLLACMKNELEMRGTDV